MTQQKAKRKGPSLKKRPAIRRATRPAIEPIVDPAVWDGSLSTLKYHTEKYNNIYKGLQTLYHVTAAALAKPTPKHEPLIITTGPGGLGKTWTLEQCFKKLNIRATKFIPGRNIYHFQEEAHRTKDFDAVVLDDSDQLVSQRDSQNMVKQGWGIDRRIVCTPKRGSKLPPTFVVKSVMIWCTNCEIVNDQIIVPPTLRESFKALLSRGGKPIEIGGTPAEMFQYMMYLAIEKNALREIRSVSTREWMRTSRHVMEDTVNLINENRQKIPLLTPRTLTSIAFALHSFRGDRTNPECLAKLSLAISDINVRGPILGFKNKLKLSSTDQWEEA